MGRDLDGLQAQRAAVLEQAKHTGNGGGDHDGGAACHSR